jgi:hypothetical protein
MSIPQGHLEIAVPKQFPDGIQIHSGHDEFAGKVMSHIMPPEMVDFCQLQQGLP